MAFGLPQRTITQLKSVFKKYPEITQVKIYGSRATGYYRRGSDIDLAFFSESEKDLSSNLSWDLDDLPCPYLFDLVNYSLLNDSPLKKEINKYGRVFYKKMHSSLARQKSISKKQSSQISFPLWRESSKKISKTKYSFALKKTEIGEIPKEWTVIPFEKCIKKIAIDRVKQVQKSQYLKTGKFPIIDQGKLFISGWTNDNANLFDGELPIIVFGDHTRVFKYINKPFALGADGTKLIKPNNDYNTKYFYYIMKSLSIPNKGYNRHYKILKGVFLSRPPFPEQQKIAGVLSQIQRAIEIQDRLIEATEELKKSTMKQLFTYGIKGNKTKNTFLDGMSNQQNNTKWPLVKLGDICILEYGKPLKREERRNGRYPVFGSNGVVGYHNRYLIEGPCIIVGRKGTAGEVTYSENSCFPIDTTFFVQLKDTSQYNLKCFYFIMRTLGLKKMSTKSNVPGLNRNDVYKILIPRPPISEQEEIAGILNKIDQKIQIHKKKKLSFEELFKTTLSKLMTGTIRVHKLNINANLVK